MKLLAKRARPLVASYRVNAGFIPKDSWVQDPSWWETTEVTFAIHKALDTGQMINLVD